MSPRCQRVAFIFLVSSCSITQAQTQSLATAQEMKRIEGTDPDDHVSYVRLILTGTLVASADITSPPALTAQCTKQITGKLGFELFANYGGVEDDRYHRRWMPKDGGLFPPATQKVSVTMEFLGYRKVKPVKRQWELMEQPPGQLRYNTPSGSSSNMEDITFYLQYLKALPTLRLTYNSKAAQFVVSPLLEQIHKEPLCRASGL